MYSVKVTIRDTPKSQFLEDHIIKKALKLNQYCQQISKCRVVVDMPQKHKHQGKLFRVSIELNVRGKELVVNRKLDEDVYVAVAQAFDAIERKLEDYTHRHINNIRKRRRAANDGFPEFNNRNNRSSSHFSSKGSNDSFSKKINDESYMDEIDFEYDDLTQIIQNENINIFIGD
jgi:ribosomal subunit interface protein